MSNYNYGQRGGPGGASSGSAEDPTANGSAATSSRGRYGFGTGGAFQPIASDAPQPPPRVPSGNPSTGSMADSLLLEMVEKAIETKLAKIDRYKFKLLKNTLLSSTKKIAYLQQIMGVGSKKRRYLSRISKA